MIRSGLVSFMLFISISLSLAGWAYSKDKADNSEGRQPHVIDINKFDPFDLFQHMIEEGAARDKTRVRTCYSGANIDFSFASVADDNNVNQALSGYDTVSDRSGRTYRISTSRLLDKGDIDMVCVDKTSYNGNEQYSIILVFKETSWDKVYAVTQNLIKKRLACLKSQTVLSVSVVYQALARAAQIAVLNKAADIDWFIQGLILTNYPEGSREQAYTKWLESRVQNYPDDLESLENLARQYHKTKPDCKKSLTIYEKVIKFNPNFSYFSYYFPVLNSCYIDSGDFDRAIKFYNSLIGEKGTEPMTAVYLRLGLASAYDCKREKQKTLQQLSLAVNATKAVPTSYPWLKDNPNGEAIEKKLQDQKTQMIKLLETEIEKIKSQED